MSDFAKLLWVGLITLADDCGRFRADPVLIRSDLFPRDEHPRPIGTIHAGVAEIAAAGMVQLYESEGQSYGVIPKWLEFQHLKNARKSYFPEPPALKSIASAKKHSRQKGGTERKGGESNLSAPRADVREACQEVPSAPPQEGPEEAPCETKRGSGAFQSPASGASLAAHAPHNVQRAWELILGVTEAWGQVRWPTLTRVYQHTRVAPERVLAAVLDIAGNPKIESAWGALSNLLKRKWCPTERALAVAKQTIRGNPGPRNGLGTIGDTLKEMGGKT